MSDTTSPKPTHRHKKSRGLYAVIGIGHMQTDNWWSLTGAAVPHLPVDMEEVVIYRSIEDSSLWVRPIAEFQDGRFEKLEDGRHDHMTDAYAALSWALAEIDGFTLYDNPKQRENCRDRAGEVLAGLAAGKAKSDA